MLFLVTMTHTAESCPGNDPDKMRETLEVAEKMEPMAKELGIKVHFMLSAALGHVVYALVEADSVDVLSRFGNGIPFPQDYTVTPVEPLEDMMKRAKEMLEQQK